MATFTWTPSMQVLDAAPKILSARFGDGYEQRIGDGVAPVADRVYNLTFKRLQDLAAINGFLVQHVGVDPFTWTPNGDAEAGYYLCRTWGFTVLPAGERALTARFERAYV